MRAVTWHGTHDVRVDSVPDPEIINPRDAILKITSTAICGSDLHLYDGVIPGVVPGDVLGHEFMGEVVETGKDSTLKKGQRVVVPFTISCGGCFHCQIKQYSACENSNPAEKQDMSATLYGHPMAALFGYSHLTGGYSGGQAEYVRVPFSDVGPIVIPDHLEDDQVLFLSDILPTGWMGAENAEIQPDDTVAVWGCGPVGLFARIAVSLQQHGGEIGDIGGEVFRDQQHGQAAPEIALQRRPPLGDLKEHVIGDGLVLCLFHGMPAPEAFQRRVGLAEDRYTVDVGIEHQIGHH